MKKYQRILAYGFLVIATLLPRLLDLDAFLSPDEPQWERNTQNFVLALTEGDTKGFYQQPHPGITTQWLAAASIQAETWGVKRLPQAFFLSIAVLYITHLAKRLWGNHIALIAGFLLALNPLLIAHSRILAMDALLGVFMLAALLHHLLWVTEKQKKDIALAGVFTSLAVLSKMSGAGIVLYVIIASVFALLARYLSWKQMTQGVFWYCVAGAITTIVVFPTIITNFPYVLEGSKQFFSTEHFTQQVHALGQWWYPEAFLLWTTPIQLIGLLVISFVFYRHKEYRIHTLFLIIFCILFFLEIQYSIKKGDRYMLPVFLALDIATAVTLGALLKSNRKYIVSTAFVITVLGVTWQAYEIAQLHPYALAYRNPLFASVAEGRTMGWGEGLDLAAKYLNAKDDAENLLVAAYYEGSFAYHFTGNFTSAERLAKESAEEIGADYVVLYRTMQGRAPERWETKVLQEYSQKTPEHVIKLNNEEYVWIYKGITR